MSAPDCQPARNEIAPFQVGYPAAAARRYARALRNRTISACRVRAGKLGVAKSAKQPDTSPWRAWRPDTHKKPRAVAREKRRRRWTPKEDQLVRRHYGAVSMKKMIALLGGKRTEKAIVFRAWHLRRCTS